MRSALPSLLLLALALPAAAAAPRDPLRELDDCLEHLAPGPALPSDLPLGLAALDGPTAHGPQGLEALQPICPGLEAAILQSGLSPRLPEDWQRRLDRGRIADLRWLLSHYRGPSPAGAPLVDSLYPIARHLNEPVGHRSWWQALRDWLRSLLAPTPDAGPSWLSGWLSQATLPPALLRLMLYALLCAVIGIAGWIVRRELIAAGVGAGGPRAARSMAAPLPASARSESAEIAAINAAPLAQQPALLLQLLVHTLVRTGRLDHERSLTHRELPPHSRFDQPAQRQQFEQLTRLAERLLYGPCAPAAGAGAEIDATVLEARRLYAQLAAVHGGAR